LRKGEHARDAVEHLAEAGEFPFEMLDTGVGDTVDARRAAFRGNTFFGLEKPLTEHALEGRIEGTFFDLEQVIGDLLDVLHEGIAMHGLMAKRLKDHDFECSGEKVAVVGVSGHGAIVALDSYFVNRYIIRGENQGGEE
jgi:hypothetical protein